MRSNLRLGVIGAGAIGRKHLRACQTCRGVEVAAVCDVDAGRVREAAAAFDVPRALASHRQLLAGDGVDAVSICTPNNTHMPIALAALKAGKHVLCEKPLGLNARQARRMVRAAEEAGLLLMVAQSARYGAAAQFVKGLADAGRFGEIYYAKALWLRRAGIPKGWFQDAEQSGGGPLIDLGVHAVDLMWWVMGRPRPVTAFGVTFDHLGRSGQGMGDWGVGYNPAGFSVEDMVAALVRFEDGRALGIDISWAAHTSDLYWLRLFGTKGGVQISPELVTYETDGKASMDSFAKLPEQDTYSAEIRHFAECIRRGREPISPGAQAVVVTAMLDAIGRAASTGRAVRVSVE
jgi:predicted dehydrogenase